ncbi:MAG: lipopolysaccharide biosynthesis protein [Bacillota bacterium]
MTETKNQVMARDTIIYMTAKIIEGLVGILTISAMTHLYAPNEMGKYTTINVAVTTIAMVAIQWLTQSVFRHLTQYRTEDEKTNFYSTVFYSWVQLNGILLVVGSTIFMSLYFFDTEKIFEIYPRNLLLLGFIMCFTYNTAQMMISMLAGLGQSKTNLVLSIINVVGKLSGILVLNTVFSSNIQFVFLSYIIFDCITVVVGVRKLQIIKYIKRTHVDKSIQKLFIAYGTPLTFNMIATSLLNKSDIYIITYLLGETQAGIYQTNYSIVASAFILLASGAMRGSYPTILKTWNENNPELTKKLLQVAIRNYLLIGVPAVVGIFSVSSPIAQVLFETKYWEGHSVMGFVALGMMFLGLTEYAIKGWELNLKTQEIAKRSFLCGLFNIALNLIFIKKFGYVFGGVSTFLAFFLYFLLAVYGTRNDILFSVNFRSLLNILIGSAVMGIVVHFAKSFVAVNVISLAMLVFLGLLSYAVTLFFLGELKNEIAFLQNKLQKKNTV